MGFKILDLNNFFLNVLALVNTSPANYLAFIPNSLTLISANISDSYPVKNRSHQIQFITSTFISQ